MALAALPLAAAACGPMVTTNIAIDPITPVDESEQALTSGALYRIVSGEDGLSAGVAGASTASGATIVQWGYTPTQTNLQWTLTSAGSNYTLKAKNSGLCLGAPAGNNTNGTGLVQLACSGTNTQWSLNAQGSGQYYLINAGNGLCMSIGNDNWSPAQQYVQWQCVGGANQFFRLEALNASGVPTFGYRTLHANKLGFYMTPDFYNAWYWTGAASGACPWGNVQNSFNRLQQLIPGAMVRWDTEFGHANGDPIPVNTTLAGDVLSCGSGTKFVISAEGVPGYNNYWAGGNKIPSTSLLDMAGAQNQFLPTKTAAAYANVSLVETSNEPDNSLFNSDGDNTANWTTYYNAMKAGTAVPTSKIVGPATSWAGGSIWNQYLSTGTSNVSYHTYGGASTLQEVNGKSVYVTEYGGNNGTGWSGNGYNVAYPSPGWVLADMWSLEHDQHLSGSIQRLFYHQLFDDSVANRGAFLHASSVGSPAHFQARDWLHALSMYVAATSVSSNAYFNEAQNDYFATDDGNGNTAAVLWNYSLSPYVNTGRGVPGSSASATATWYVAHVAPGDTETFTCYAATDSRQTWVTVGNNAANGSPASMLTVTIKNLEPHGALLVTTKNCAALAN